MGVSNVLKSGDLTAVIQVKAEVVVQALIQVVMLVKKR
jgi:hypothetical protein